MDLFKDYGEDRLAVYEARYQRVSNILGKKEVPSPKSRIFPLAHEEFMGGELRVPAQDSQRMECERAITALNPVLSKDSPEKTTRARIKNALIVLLYVDCGTKPLHAVERLMDKLIALYRDDWANPFEVSGLLDDALSITKDLYKQVKEV